MHPINCEGKCFTKTELIHANKAAIREKRNRQLNEEFLEELPDEGLFPIALAFDEHNRGEIRVQIIFDEEGTRGFLDLSKNRYDLLPVAIIEADGTVNLKYSGKSPYPMDREIEEKVVKKVVRDPKFRKIVLTAYDNQCAMCYINDTSLLVAAHIFPARLCGDDSVNNGICLCSNHDKAYEQGSILVKPDGRIVIHRGNVEVNNEFIRFPMNKNEHPSQERLRQRLKLSMEKQGIDELD